MASSFQVFAVKAFPKTTKFQTTEQLSLFSDHENNIEVCRTLVTAGESNNDDSLQIYRVEHDFLFKLEYPGRARGIAFREFVTPYRFSMFLGTDGDGVGFRPLLVRTKRAVATDFARRLNEKVSSFRINNTMIDLERLKPRLRQINGAWFGAITAPHLATTGVFGPQVHLSDEYKHAESIGELRSLLIDAEYGGVRHAVMVTTHGGIVLYNKYPDPLDEAFLAHQILTSMIAGCVSPKEPRETSA